MCGPAEKTKRKRRNGGRLRPPFVFEPFGIRGLLRTCPKTGGCEEFVRTPKTKG
ncbi:hypothetical protein HMPREF9440_00064, partial [Sutterella parvirubra YIT 11816]